MKFEIKARITGSVLFTADIPDDTEPRFQVRAALQLAVSARANLAGADLAGADLAGANLARADLADADLADANLADADLARANLAGANLAGAYLARADLAGANLAGAYLARANLARANLAGAYLARANLARANLADAISEPASEDEIARLDKVRDIVLNKPERLRMNDWHSDSWSPDHTPEEEHECGSAHCIAGWLQALCEDPEMRAHQSAQYVGEKLAPASRHMFFTSDAVALQWLKDRGYARHKQAA